MTTGTELRLTKYIPDDHIERLNDKQHAALWCNHRELLYGGAAGGGKSDFLLMAALQYVDIPEYSAIIFRKTYTDLSLPGALMDRAHIWLDGTDARWKELDKQWVFPSGANLNFGYLKTDQDKYRYQSAEFQFVGFDELTQFDETDYLYLFSRIRGPATGDLSRVPLRMRSASNPGGRGHTWVKKRFIDPHEESERIFIPASLFDNSENINVDGYVAGLDQLDAQTRKQLLEGDWTARPPGDWYFDERHIQASVDLAATLYDPALGQGELGKSSIPPVGGGVYLGIDWGEHTQAYCIWPLPGGGVYIPPSEVAAFGAEPGEVARRMLVRASSHGYPIRAARYDAAGIQPMRTFIKTAQAVGYRNLKPAKIPFAKFKVTTARYLRHLFENTFKGLDQRVIAISPANEELIRQLPQLEIDPENMRNAWLKDEDQHGPDALIAGVAPIAAKNEAMIEKQLEQAKIETVAAGIDSDPRFPGARR